MAIDGTGVPHTTLMALEALLVLVSAVPYLFAIEFGGTRPRILSWSVWTLLGAIATAAAFTAGEYPSAALTAAATVETGSIVGLAWTCGNRTFERLDAYCLVGITLGLILWAVSHSPLVGDCWPPSPWTSRLRSPRSGTRGAGPTRKLLSLTCSAPLQLRVPSRPCADTPSWVFSTRSTC